jgi:hypothetical protein
VSQRDWDDAYLINAAYDIDRDDPALGYRFIADELLRRGLTTRENRVARLCSQQRICSVFAKKRGLNHNAALERPAPRGRRCLREPRHLTSNGVSDNEAPHFRPRNVALKARGRHGIRLTSR